MRVLQVVHQSLPRWVGGTELYAHQLAQALLARGHDVQVFVREDDGRGLTHDRFEGITIHRIHTPPKNDRAKFQATFGDRDVERGFEHVLAHVQPDLVHFQHLLGMPAALFWRVIQAGLPTVITLHDYWFICANTKLLTNYHQRLCRGPRAWLNCALCGFARAGTVWAAPLAPAVAPVFAARDFRLRQILRRADCLIAPTEFVRQIYIEHGAPAARMLVVEHGIEPPPIVPPPLAPEAPLQAAYIGSVARLKGVDVLVAAFNALPPEARLWIAGDLTREPEYVRELRQMTSHPGIAYLGQIDRRQLWELLGRVDVVAVPSLWYEVSPLVVQEAFAMRRPVVASRLGSLATLVRDDVDGVLTPPGDIQAWSQVLLALARDRTRLMRLQNGIRPVKTLAQHVAEIEDVYARARHEARPG